MNNTDKPNFAKLLMSLAELHNKKLSGQLLDIYWHSLKAYAFEDIKSSLNKLIVDPDVGQFMPKPADVVRYIEGDSKSQALIAWGKVMQAIQSVGAWDSVVFDDRKIHAVILDMGGWVELCRKTSHELVFLSKEFESRYSGYRYKKLETMPQKLLGRVEHANAYQGDRRNSETKYIGVQKVHAVLSQLESDRL